jgi:hypothetical protein
MPGLLSKFRTPPIFEIDVGPALPPVPAKNDRARPAPPPVRLADAAVPALPPEPVKDDPNVPVLPSKQSLLARLLVRDDADYSATPHAETTNDAPRHRLPAVNTRKKERRGCSEPQQGVVVQEQAAEPHTGNTSAAQNIVVNVTTAATVPYWGWAGCWSWSCPFRRGLVCRRWWCW